MQVTEAGLSVHWRTIYINGLPRLNVHPCVYRIIPHRHLVRLGRVASHFMYRSF
jgi:hypothetical protein